LSGFTKALVLILDQNSH